MTVDHPPDFIGPRFEAPVTLVDRSAQENSRLPGEGVKQAIVIR
jgi:hypothetical protein